MIEQLGKAADSFIDAMKSQPLALALAVMNVALLVVFWYILSVVAEQRKREVEMMYSEARSVREQLTTALQKCGALQQNFFSAKPIEVAPFGSEHYKVISRANCDPCYEIF